jgi:preprotein translocase subunit SecG
MIYTFLIVLHVIVCMFLILVVLLQSGKGGGLGVFGGGGGGSVFGGRGGATFLSKLTTITATLFMVMSIILARLSIDTSRVEAATADQAAETDTTEGAAGDEPAADEPAADEPAAEPAAGDEAKPAEGE